MSNNEGLLYCKVFTDTIKGGRDAGHPTRGVMVSDRFARIANREKGAVFYRLVPMTQEEVADLNNETKEIDRLKDLAAKYPHIATIKETK